MTAQEMKVAADALKQSLPPGTGFVIMTISNQGDSGLQQWNYVSNCPRIQMIEALEVILAKWKAQKDTNN